MHPPRGEQDERDGGAAEERGLDALEEPEAARRLVDGVDVARSVLGRQAVSIDPDALACAGVRARAAVVELGATRARAVARVLARAPRRCASSGFVEAARAPGHVRRRAASGSAGAARCRRRRARRRSRRSRRSAPARSAARRRRRRARARARRARSRAATVPSKSKTPSSMRPLRWSSGVRHHVRAAVSASAASERRARRRRAELDGDPAPARDALRPGEPVGAVLELEHERRREQRRRSARGRA